MLSGRCGSMHENGFDGWVLVLAPKGPFVEGCTILSCPDGSGSLRGPRGEELADWDLLTHEVEAYSPSGMSHSLINPYEPDGDGWGDICYSYLTLYDEVEDWALELWPELVRSDEAA